MKDTLRITIIGFIIFLMPISGLAFDVSGRLILMWQVQKNVSGDELKFMKQKGVNLIQSFNITRWYDNDIKEYFDKAFAYEIGVVVTIGRLLKGDVDPKEFNYARAASFIKKWKHHPAIFAWHMLDEPCNAKDKIPPSIQREAYLFIKSLDPYRKILISWNGTSRRHYNCCFSEEAFDILDLHAYVRTLPGRRQINLIKEFLKNRKGDYPIIITLRSFNRPKHPKLPIDGLKRQYEFFFKRNKITNNIGFYGWSLKPNKGIKNDPDIMRQFKGLEMQTN